MRITMMPYSAIIVEGTAERIIMQRLLQANYLIISNTELLGRKILHTRNAKLFAKQYLSHSFEEKVQLYRILDSKKEVFKLPKAYEQKVQVINVLTTPEIEMLLICSEGLLSTFKQINGKKPSNFMKDKLHLNVKTTTFNEHYWSADKIVKAVIDYHRTSATKNEFGIYNLLRPDVIKLVQRSIK